MTNYRRGTFRTALLALLLILGSAGGPAAARDGAPRTNATAGADAAMGTKPARQQDRWAVYYADALPVTAFTRYDLLVFSARRHPDLRPLQDRGIKVFGYLSVGEVATHEPHFAAAKKDGLLKLQNPNWPDAWMVDLRDKRWTEMLLYRLIPALLREGFDGIFFDTLDDAGYLERQDPKANAGMVEAARRMVRAIHRHFPTVPVIMNRGYDLLPDVAGDVDYILGKSVATDYDFETKTYGWVPDALYREQLGILKGAQKANPKLTVLTLDYWKPDDPQTIAEIYRRERANGFWPYVATIDLDRLVPGPAQ